MSTVYPGYEPALWERWDLMDTTLCPEITNCENPDCRSSFRQGRRRGSESAYIVLTYDPY